MNDQPLQTTAHKNDLLFLFLLCFISGTFGGLTSTLAPSYLPVISENFAHTNLEKIGAFINASFIYGMLAGGIALGYWSDKFGRKPGFQIAVLCIGLFTLLSSFVQTWIWLVVFRFLTGFGVGGILLTGTIIITEVWPARSRAIALGILSICFPVGIFSAGLITYFVKDWRHAFWVGLLPLALALWGQFFLRETDAWLQNKAVPRTKSEGRNMQAILPDILLGSLIYGAMLIGLWAVFAWLPTWVQTIVQNSDGQQERGISMMIFAAGGLLGGFFSGWLGKRFGIKSVLLWCFGGCFVLSVFLFKFTFSLTVYAYLGMAIIALFFGISQGVLNVYIPELFPTLFRSTATGICFNISRIFTATVVFFVGWLVVALQGFGNALFVFSFVFLIGFVVMLFSSAKKPIPE